MNETSHLEHLAVVGLSHRTAPFDVLERLALAPVEIDAFYEELRAEQRADSAIVLSTCNRTEIYAVAANGAQELVESLVRTLRKVVGEQRLPSEEGVYRAAGAACVKHLFRVACGLDSMILGEAQILGQLKAAYEEGGGHLAPTPSFDRIMQSAFRVGARTRTETEIGRGAVSVASAATHLATRIYSDLSRCNVVVIGAGDTGRLLAQHLMTHGPARLTIVNRTTAKAEAVARELGAQYAAMDELPRLLAEAHVVGSAIRAPSPVLTRAMLEAARPATNGSTLAVLDLGLPRNVAADAHSLANIFVHDLTALEKIVDANLARRRKAVPTVETLIEEELARLVAWQQSLQAGPLIAALRESVEAARLAEVDRATRGLSQAERDAVDRATRAVVNKLLHGPMTTIKESAQREDSDTRLQVIHDVFKNLRDDKQG